MIKIPEIKIFCIIAIALTPIRVKCVKFRVNAARVHWAALGVGLGLHAAERPADYQTDELARSDVVPVHEFEFGPVGAEKPDVNAVLGVAFFLTGQLALPLLV